MKKNCFLILSIFLFQFAVGQQNEIDSLINLLKQDKNDTTKLTHLYSICDNSELIGNYEQAFKYANKAIAFANELIETNKNKNIIRTAKKYKAQANIISGIVHYIQGNYAEALKNNFAALKTRIALGDKKGTASTYNNIGLIYQRQGNFPEALKNHMASLNTCKSINDKTGIARSYINIGIIHWEKGDYPLALKNYFASLKFFEGLGDKNGIASCYNNIGNVYMDQGNYPEALKNYFASLKIEKENGNKYGIADSYNNIGLVYKNQGNYPKALENITLSLKLKDEIGDQQGIADSHNNLGLIYTRQGNNPEAIKNYTISLEIEEKIGDRRGLSSSFLNLGVSYLKLNQIKKAKTFLEKGLLFSKEIGSKENIKISYHELACVDSIMKNYKSQVENYKLYVLYRDSLNNEETRKKTIQSQLTYEFERKEAVAAAEHKIELKNQAKISEEKNRKQKLITAFVIGGLLLVLIFAGFVFRSLRITRKQKAFIEMQKMLVEQHQKEIIDSIHYAKRIQTALLPSDKNIEKNINRLKKA